MEERNSVGAYRRAYQFNVADPGGCSGGILVDGKYKDENAGLVCEEECFNN